MRALRYLLDFARHHRYCWRVGLAFAALLSASSSTRAQSPPCPPPLTALTSQDTQGVTRQFACYNPATGATTGITSTAQGIDPTQTQYAGGVKRDGKAAFGSTSTITITNASTTVVVSTAAFTSADVGKDIYGTNGCCGVATSYQGVLVLPRGTIVSITNSTTVVVTVAATSGCTGTGCIVVWGTNDDAAWTSAEAAWQSGTGKCSSIQWPVGLSLSRHPHFNNTGSGCGATEPELDFTGSVIGYGAGASVLAIEPDFVFPECVFGLGLNGCFFSDTEMVVKDVGLWGAGYGNTGTNAKVMVNPGVGSTLSQVGLIAFGGSDVSLIGIQMAAAFRGYYNICDGMGRTCGSVTNTGASNQAFCFGCFFGDNLGPYLNINASNNYVSYGGQYGTTGGTVGINQAGNYYGFGEFLFTCSQIANATAIFMSNFANAETWLDGSNFNCPSTTSNGVFMNAATQKLHLANGTTIGGTTAAINRLAGVVYMSDDTKLLGTIGTSLRPALATSGNGTIAVSGTGLARNELGMFTLTAGTTSGATPTITITFAGTPLGPGGGAPRCDLSLLNGTVDGVTFSGAWNARFSQTISSLSTTAVTYTIDNNAVALTNGSTYGGQYSCRFS